MLDSGRKDSNESAANTAYRQNFRQDGDAMKAIDAHQGYA